MINQAGKVLQDQINLSILLFHTKSEERYLQTARNRSLESMIKISAWLSNDLFYIKYFFFFFVGFQNPGIKRITEPSVVQKPFMVKKTN